MRVSRLQSVDKKLRPFCVEGQLRMSRQCQVPQTGRPAVLQWRCFVVVCGWLFQGQCNQQKFDTSRDFTLAGAHAGNQFGD